MCNILVYVVNHILFQILPMLNMKVDIKEITVATKVGGAIL